MSLSGSGAIVLGLFLVVIAGILNGSWNASFSPTHGLAVGRNLKDNNKDSNSNGNGNGKDLSYHLAWILFQIYAAAINIPICIYWAGGPARVQYIVQETSALDIGLVSLFSILWGGGSIGFGLACKVAGVGLGTNLCMGVIMVLGTFLPLCLDGAIGTAAGGVVVGGLVVCCIGLVYSVKSLQLRDASEREQRIRRRTMYNTTVSLSIPTAEEGSEIAAAVADAVNNQKVEDDDEEEGEQQPEAPPALSRQEQPEETGGVPDEKALTVKSTSGDDNDNDTDDGPSTFHKVAVCVIAGIFASQLQFAFVFGNEMIAIAGSSQGPGSTPPSGTSSVIWLFAFSLGAPPSIIYGIYSNPPDISLKRLYQCPWYRHVLVILTTSLPWVAHIHLYGYANTNLPSDLAASVAWPVLMMMTVITGIVWSIGLGEWKGATPGARWKLYQGLGIVTIGIAIIMASVAI